MTENNQNSENEELLIKLDVIGHGGWFLWKVFLLCTIPSILNGLNLTSYIYLAEVPEHWCAVPELSRANWTDEQIRTVSSPKGINGSSCNFYDYDYESFASMTFEEVLKYVSDHKPPNQKPCREYDFLKNTSSMVVDYSLVCERTALKSTIQVALSLGKFIGAFFFGMISDKYGRRLSFLMGSLFYAASGPMVSFASNYGMIIAGRIGLGAAGSAIYHSAYIILSEVASKKRRANLGILYNMSYPIGQMIVPLIAYFVTDWRTLQLSISVPALLCILFYWCLPESPRWLISTGKRMEAAKLIEKVYSEKLKARWEMKAKLKGDVELPTVAKLTEDKSNVQITPKQSNPQQRNESGSPTEGQQSSYQVLCQKLHSVLNQLFELVRHAEIRNRLLITLFCWCVCSLSYYALALNVDNFHTDRYIYGFLTGLVEVPSYILPLPFLKYFGRRHTAIGLFFVGGASLVGILAIPREEEYNLYILIVASIGRLCSSAVFAVVILHTTELFPTVIRNTAIGSGSTAAHVGSMSAPLLVDLLGAYAWFIPSTVCGIATLLAGILMFLLPETKNKPLPDTVHEILDSPKSEKVGFHQCCR